MHFVSSRVPFHSIVGDRGKGDTPDSSDGVVSNWSSHLDGAVSKKIIPSGHGSQENQEGIEEARQILHFHFKETPCLVVFKIHEISVTHNVVLTAPASNWPRKIYDAHRSIFTFSHFSIN